MADKGGIPLGQWNGSDAIDRFRETMKESTAAAEEQTRALINLTKWLVTLTALIAFLTAILVANVLVWTVEHW